jgi:hypothetical protein
MLTPLICAAIFSSGESGALAEPFIVQANGKPIKLKIGHAAPTMADFDGDGKNDLLVGEFSGGGIRFYKNMGTPAEPKFTEFTMIAAGGKPIKVEAG